MISMGWIASFLVFMGLELIFGSLTSLWFAAGALGAFVTAFVSGTMEQQLVAFTAVSFLTLFMIRPVAFALYRQRRAGGHH